MVSAMVVYERQGWQQVAMILRYQNAEVKLHATPRAMHNLYAIGKSAAALEPGARASATAVAEMAVALRHRPKKSSSRAARAHGEEVHRRLLRKRRHH